MKSIRNHYKNSKHILVILIALLASAQAQSFNERSSIDAGSSIIYSIFGSDLDGDGFGEVIVLYDDNSTGEELRVYEASGGNTYGSSAQWSDVLTTSTNTNDADNNDNNEIKKESASSQTIITKVVKPLLNENYYFSHARFIEKMFKIRLVCYKFILKVSKK